MRKAVVHGDTAIDDAAAARIVIGLPAHAEAADRAHAQDADHRRGAARSHQEGVGGEVRRGADHVALAGNQRAAEGGVEVALLEQFPGEDLLHGIAALGVDAIGDGEQQFVGIAGQIVFVEADEADEVVADAGDIAVGDARFDHVLELVAEDRLLVEDAGQRRKNQVERKIARAAHNVGAHHLDSGPDRAPALRRSTSPECRSSAPGECRPDENMPVTCGEKPERFMNWPVWKFIDQNRVGRIEDRLGAVEQTGRRFEGEKERQRVKDLAATAGEFHFGEFADGHRVGHVVGRLIGRGRY